MMNSKIYTTVITFICIAGFMLGDVVTSELIAAFNDGERPLAIIRRFKPDVFVKHADDKTWSDAKMASPLFDSDTLRTESDGYAAVQFMDNSLVKIKPNSLLIIRGEVIDKNSTASRIAVEVGEIFLNVTKRQSKFEVNTPTAVASVKGTSYNTDVDKDGSTTVLVLSGSVELIATKTGQKVTLKRSDKGNVNAKNSNLTVTKASKKEMGEKENDYDNLDSGTKPKTIKLRFQNDVGQSREIEIQYFEKEQ